eukprot:4129923-Alexandrium_andersonii.AAC.1
MPPSRSTPGTRGLVGSWSPASPRSGLRQATASRSGAQPSRLRRSRGSSCSMIRAPSQWSLAP